MRKSERLVRQLARQHGFTVAHGAKHFLIMDGDQCVATAARTRMAPHNERNLAALLARVKRERHG